VPTVKVNQHCTEVVHSFVVIRRFGPNSFFLCFCFRFPFHFFDVPCFCAFRSLPEHLFCLLSVYVSNFEDNGRASTDGCGITFAITRRTVLLLCREDRDWPTNDATDNSDKSMEHGETETLTPPSSDAVKPLSTLSRTVMSLSRCDLNSSSSLHDVTCPLEVDVVDDTESGVSRTDRLRIEMFYRSHETEVYVCSSLADLFVGALRPGGAGAAGRWVHLHTGVPVWLLNSGRGRRRRELIVALAERRTGLPLWHDRITYLSNYTQADDGQSSDDASHVMRPSSNLSSAVRISMFNRRSAAAFIDRFHRFTADPVDDLWKISDDRGGAGTGDGWPWRRWRQRRRCLGGDQPESSDTVSQPCHVLHISRTDVRQPSFRAAFAHLLPPPPCSSPTDVTSSAADCPVTSQSACTEAEQDRFRPRLPTR